MGTSTGIVILALFGLALIAPSESSLVVSSKESTKENEKEVLPGESFLYPIIYEMNINSNISNRFAKTLVISKIKNTEKTAKETTFTVILPEKAFISEFVMEIGGKSYKAYVKEKEEAKNIYQQALASGRSAGHVAVSARDSNKFTVSVNIEPESKAAFLLTYEELLQRKDNQYELVVNIHPGQIVKKLSVEVLVNESRPLRFVKTPSLRSGNEISKNEDKLDPSSNIKIINSTSAVVKFNPDSERQKQFARDLGTKESDGLSGQFVVQYDVERDPHGGEILLQDGYFVHFFAPIDLEPIPKHVVFVLDTSGSMGGRKIDQLKDAMNSILTEIEHNDVIHILEFNNNVIVWDITSEQQTVINSNYGEVNDEPFGKLKEINLPSPTIASNVNINKSKDVIHKIDAQGGTYMMGGLETALYLIKLEQEKRANKSEKYQPIIIFLTDGEPNIGLSSTKLIVERTTKLNSNNNKVPIFSLSFGTGADKAFLRQLSTKNLGFSRHIYEASDASLQLQNFFKQISSPLLSNVKFQYDSDVQEVTKSYFPIFFRGSELVVTGKYQDSSIPTTVDGWGSRGRIILRPRIEKPVTSLERLWAYLTVKQVLDERGSAENKTELTKKAVDLALKYSFVTDVTSLVVVKPNDTSAVNAEDASKGYEPGYPSTYSGRDFVAKSGLFSGPSTNYLRFGGGGSSYSGSSGYRSHFVALSARYQPGEKGGRYSDLVYPTNLNRDISSGPFLKGVRGPPRPPPTTTLRPNLESTLPWLSSVLNANKTLSISQGVYELGNNYFPNLAPKECPKTPKNTTEPGVCTLLKNCPEVHSLLTDFQVYQKYFCPVDNKYAGVCCPKQI